MDDPDLPPRLLFLEKENEDDFDLQSPVAGILGLGPTTIEHPGFVLLFTTLLLHYFCGYTAMITNIFVHLVMIFIKPKV